MIIKQVSVFLENKSGRLNEVTQILGDAGLNMSAFTIADTSDFGILRLIVNDVPTTIKILNDNGLRVSKTTVVAVEVPDRPGGLHSILEVLAKNNINVEYLYAFVEKSGENAVIIFRFDAPDGAIDVLLKNGFTVLPGEKLYSF